MSIEAQQDPQRYNRRQFLGTTVLVAETILLAACGRASSFLPTAVPTAYGQYALTEESDGSLTDARFGLRQHPFVEAVRFSFDLNRAGGSLVLDATFRKDNEFRLITEETDYRVPANPGLIYCMSTKEKAGTVRKYPVIRFVSSETYLISLGVKLSGEDCLKTYQEMPTYFITKDINDNLHGRFEGLRTFNPNDPNFKPRDVEARYYFDKGCLT